MVLRLVFLASLLTESNDALEWFQKGQNLFGTPQEYSQEQAQYFEKAIELAPDLETARHNLALIYIRQQKFDRALLQLGSLIQLRPGDPSGYLLRARVRIQTEDWGKAAADLEKALEIDPTSPEAWEGLSSHHLRQNATRKQSKPHKRYGS